MKYKKYLKVGGIVLGVLVVAFLVVRSLFGGSLQYGDDMGYNAGMMEPMHNERAVSRMQKSAPMAMDSDMAMESEEMIMEEVPYGDDANAPTDKKIIKEGSMTLRVDKVDPSVEKVRSIVKSYQGEVFSMNFSQSSTNVKSGTITVKVPMEKFEQAFDGLKTVADLVLRESSTGQDVTAQYIDLQSRLKNKQAEERSFVKLLERAGDMGDVLKVTRELSRVRGEIELLQGRIRVMDSRTDMSTINVFLSEDPEITVVDSWRPWQEVKEAVNALIEGLQGFIHFLIVLVVQIIPMLILYGVVILVVFLIGRKVYRKVQK